jgi:putative hydrolase of the HAD superfamily
LRGYKTRLHPREREVSFATILAELLPCFGIAVAADELACARAFFGIFRKRLRCYEDVRPTLEGLKGRGQKIGVFTDVAYGMPRELVLEDIHAAALAGFFDAVVTSVETGFRKPAVQTLQRMAQELGCKPHEMVYVGNEQKDIQVARAAGCQSVLVDRTDQRPSWGQDRTVTSLLELWVERSES